MSYNPKRECDITNQALATGLAQQALKICLETPPGTDKADIKPEKCGFSLRMNTAGSCTLIIQMKQKKMVLKIDRDAGALISNENGDVRAAVLSREQQAVINSGMKKIIEARHASAARQSVFFF